MNIKQLLEQKKASMSPGERSNNLLFAQTLKDGLAAETANIAAALEGLDVTVASPGRWTINYDSHTVYVEMRHHYADDFNYHTGQVKKSWQLKVGIGTDPTNVAATYCAVDDFPEALSDFLLCLI